MLPSRFLLTVGPTAALLAAGIDDIMHSCQDCQWQSGLPVSLMPELCLTCQGGLPFPQWQ